MSIFVLMSMSHFKYLMSHYNFMQGITFKRRQLYNHYLYCIWKHIWVCNYFKVKGWKSQPQFHIVRVLNNISPKQRVVIQLESQFLTEGGGKRSGLFIPSTLTVAYTCDSPRCHWGQGRGVSCLLTMMLDFWFSLRKAQLLTSPVAGVFEWLLTMKLNV